MDTVAGFFVGHPARFAAIGVVMALAYYLRPTFAPGRAGARPLLIAGALWLLAAAWELGITMFSPEANIRVDLLLIFPVLAIATIWALLRGWR